MFQQNKQIGKSSNYILSRIKKGKCNDIDFEKKDLFEVDFDFIVNCFINKDTLEGIRFDKRIEYIVETNMGSRNVERKITIVYNPETTFNYFTTKRCVHDGTFIVAYEYLVANILSDIMFGKTFNKENIPDDYENNWFNYDIKYTVGNFVFGNESNEKFAPKDKIWMCNRMTAMLPIKFETIKRED